MIETWLSPGKKYCRTLPFYGFLYFFRWLHLKCKQNEEVFRIPLSLDSTFISFGDTVKEVALKLKRDFFYFSLLCRVLWFFMRMMLSYESFFDVFLECIENFIFILWAVYSFSLPLHWWIFRDQLKNGPRDEEIQCEN